ncbi:cupin [Bacillus canaveralius]|uniref:Cupin n=1 Tax=Bacillus canaveralius TaxID=1403243 RepID=A0A2N5GL69_9BACI|nr:cupin domain-containing protein [Bacillus canaveralius]PLR82304.1 cupin [Bacillus canaveralius]PLR99459.1 cupin [Bacillus canaveralius]RSK49104.1 cupin domain-containing protein [Bacillus canaveralius]
MADKQFHITPEQVETLLFDWGTIKLTSTPELTGSTAFSAGVVIVDPGKGHGRHNHPGAEEIMYIISGEGEQMVEDEHGNPQVFKITAGSTVYVPESRYHYSINTGWEPMRVFVLYSPAGSEAAMRNGSDCTITEPGKVPVR